MQDGVVILNNSHQENISLFRQYADLNNTPSTIFDTVKTESVYPEEHTLLGLYKNGVILDVAHLQTERDLKVGRIELDGVSSKKDQRELLKQTENYAYTNLGMEEVVLIQNENGGLDTSYLISEGYEDLGMEDEKHIFIKPKQIEKDISFYR